MTAFTVPLGRPSTPRNTNSTGRSIIPVRSPSSNTSSIGWAHMGFRWVPVGW